MAATTDELHPCACGCGELVRGTYKRGHAARMRGRVTPMPPPGSDFGALAADAEVFGDIVDIREPPPSPGAASTDTRAPHVDTDAGAAPSGDEPLPEPPGPAHARQEERRRRRPREDTTVKKIPRVTAATRGDINAKVNFALEIPGRIWQARDPVCGTVFVDQRPEIADALTEIVCQSADLVAWFSGQGGQFMLYLNLAAALWPVATMALAHHVYHSVQVEADGSASGFAPVDPDYSRYAA